MTTATSALVAKALAIEELAYNLENISHDDKKEIAEFTSKEIVNEAKYVLDLFVNPMQGHINNEAFNGDEGIEQRRWARRQVSQLRAFIKKFEVAA